MTDLAPTNQLREFRSIVAPQMAEHKMMREYPAPPGLSDKDLKKFYNKKMVIWDNNYSYVNLPIACIVGIMYGEKLSISWGNPTSWSYFTFRSIVAPQMAEHKMMREYPAPPGLSDKDLKKFYNKKMVIWDNNYSYVNLPIACIVGIMYGEKLSISGYSDCYGRKIPLLVGIASVLVENASENFRKFIKLLSVRILIWSPSTDISLYWFYPTAIVTGLMGDFFLTMSCVNAYVADRFDDEKVLSTRMIVVSIMFSLGAFIASQSTKAILNGISSTALLVIVEGELKVIKLLSVRILIWSPSTDISLYWFYPTAIVTGLMGDFFLTMSCVNAYVADRFDDEKVLSTRMIVVSIMFSLGAFIASQSTKAILNGISSTALLVIVEGLLFATFIAGILILSQSRPKKRLIDIDEQEEQREVQSASCLELTKLSFYSIYESMKIFVIPREGHRRLFLYLSFGANFLDQLSFGEEKSLIGTYTLLSPFNWTKDEYANYKSLRPIVREFRPTRFPHVLEIQNASCLELTKLSFYSIYESMKIFVIPREGHRRLFLYLSFGANFLDQLSFGEEKSLIGTYTLLSPFNWTKDEYANYKSLRPIVQIVGMFFGIFALKRWLKLRDTFIICLAIGTLAISLFMIGLAQASWLIFASLAPGSLHGLLNPLTYTFLSCLIGRDEKIRFTIDEFDRAKHFCISSIAQKLAGFAQTAILQNIYIATLSWYQGFVWLVMGGICVVAVGIYGFVHVVAKREKIGS
ncbi:hypothetical protein OSTOST_01303 [Ostertagia ostertagi]